VATTTISRDVLMDADTVTTVIHDEVVQALGVTPVDADSYLMNHIYFSSSTQGADPTKKRPMSVIMTTVPHSVAQIREFILKPFFNSLGFPYNPMPLAKAKKWASKDAFITSYKGEKALVAAAKNMFMKVGGGSRIVRDKAAGSRCHVDMVVGHHALIASFVRNEFEIALGNRSRRRGGNDTGAYMGWVDEFAASIKHLSKNHKDHKVYGGYRIIDVIDPDLVVRTGSGGWVFTAPASAPPSTLVPAAARPASSTKRRAVESAHPPAVPSTPRTRTPKSGEDDGVGGEDTDGMSVVRPAGVVIVVDKDDDHRSGAALIGLAEEGASAGRPGRQSGVVMSDEWERDAGETKGGGSDGGESDVGGRTSSSDAHDSDATSDSSDGGDESGSASADDEDDEEDVGGVY